MNTPEYEDEQGEETKEDHDIVHGSEHDHQLSLETREEPDQLEYPEQSECSQDSQSWTLFTHSIQQTIQYLNTSVMSRL